MLANDDADRLSMRAHGKTLWEDSGSRTNLIPFRRQEHPSSGIYFLADAVLLIVIWTGLAAVLDLLATWQLWVACTVSIIAHAVILKLSGRSSLFRPRSQPEKPATSESDDAFDDVGASMM